MIEAAVSLDKCLDLGDLPGIELLSKYYHAYVETFGREHVAALVQNLGRRQFDYRVAEFACKTEAEDGNHIHVIRAPFEEGDPLWEDELKELPPSGVRHRSHVQLCVRDAACLSRLRILEPHEIPVWSTDVH